MGEGPKKRFQSMSVRDGMGSLFPYLRSCLFLRHVCSSEQSVRVDTHTATMPLSPDERLAELRRPDDGESRLVTLTAAQCSRLSSQRASDLVQSRS